VKLSELRQEYSSQVDQRAAKDVWQGTQKLGTKQSVDSRWRPVLLVVFKSIGEAIDEEKPFGDMIVQKREQSILIDS